MTATEARTETIDLNKLTPNPWQPRKYFDFVKLAELAEDIRVNGLLQPVVVRRDLNVPGGYQIAAGERRVRAFVLLSTGYEISGPAVETEDGNLIPGAGEVETVGVTIRGAADPRFTSIPALVRTLADEEMMRVAISENTQRKDVSAMEEALAYRNMIAALGGVSQTDFGKRMGLSQATIGNRLRLLKLPESVHQLIIEGKLGQFAGIKLLEWEAKHGLKPRFVELIAAALASGEAKQHEFETSPEYPLSKMKGVVYMSGNTTKFDKNEHCTTCPFFYGDLRQDWGYHLCAKPEHYKELQAKSAKEIKEEIKEKILTSKTESLEKYGVDVIRTPAGLPLQDKPERDEDGVSVIPAAYAHGLNYDDFKDFGRDSNGFDTSACPSCSFYARVDYPTAPDKKRYICLKPVHFKELYTAHDQVEKQAAQEERDRVAAEYTGFMAMQKRDDFPFMDKPTARFLARNIVKRFYDGLYGDTYQEYARVWLRQHGLNDTPSDTSWSTKPCYAWIDDLLVKAGSGKYLEETDCLNVILTAVNFVAECTLVTGTERNRGLTDGWVQEVNDYLQHLLGSGKEVTTKKLPEDAIMRQLGAPVLPGFEGEERESA